MLRKYSAALKDLITDPERLASLLHSKEPQLISNGTIRDLLTTTGISTYKKAGLVMDEAERYMTGGNEIQKFRILCEALKNDCPDNMRRIVLEMEREVASV